MEANQKQILVARLFVVAALAVAAWAMVFKTGVAASDEAGVVLALPDEVADWRGVDLLFCPDRNCGGQYTRAQAGDPPVCPRCGNDRMLSALYCRACDRHFPCRILQAKDGSRTVDPCPGCKSLENVELPPGILPSAEE